MEQLVVVRCRVAGENRPELHAIEGSAHIDSHFLGRPPIGFELVQQLLVPAQLRTPVMGKKDPSTSHSLPPHHIMYMQNAASSGAVAPRATTFPAAAPHCPVLHTWAWSEKLSSRRRAY